MIRRLATLVGLVAALLLPTVTRVQATVVIEKDLADLCSEADMIFVGKVVSVESRWRDEKHQAIETAVTFAVLEPVYGTGGVDVTLTFSGGEIDGIRAVVSGMPQFHPGEEVVLFASKQPLISPLVGFHQGCFRVVEGTNGPVVLSSSGEAVTGFSGRSLTFGKRENGPSDAMGLHQFLDTVRSQLEQRAK